MFTMLDIKVEIKSYIVREGTSLTKVMNALNEKKLITTTYSNIANKINTETITNKKCPIATRTSFTNYFAFHLGNEERL